MIMKRRGTEKAQQSTYNTENIEKLIGVVWLSILEKWIFQKSYFDIQYLLFMNEFSNGGVRR